MNMTAFQREIWSSIHAYQQQGYAPERVCKELIETVIGQLMVISEDLDQFNHNYNYMIDAMLDNKKTNEKLYRERDVR